LHYIHKKEEEEEEEEEEESQKLFDLFILQSCLCRIRHMRSLLHSNTFPALHFYPRR
jgi:hypothetical protein